MNFSMSVDIEVLVSPTSDSVYVDPCHNVDFKLHNYIYRRLDVNLSLNHFLHCDPI